MENLKIEVSFIPAAFESMKVLELITNKDLCGVSQNVIGLLHCFFLW